METECIELFERDFKKNLSKKHEETGFTVKDLGPRQTHAHKVLTFNSAEKKLTKQEIIQLQSFRPEANLIKNKYFFSMLTYMYITCHGTLTGMANPSMGFNCGLKNY